MNASGRHQTPKRTLIVACTIADRGGVDDIQVAKVAEAIQYRSLDRKFRGRSLAYRPGVQWHEGEASIGTDGTRHPSVCVGVKEG